MEQLNSVLQGEKYLHIPACACVCGCVSVCVIHDNFSLFLECVLLFSMQIYTSADE